MGAQLPAIDSSVKETRLIASSNNQIAFHSGSRCLRANQKLPCGSCSCLFCEILRASLTKICLAHRF